MPALGGAWTLIAVVLDYLFIVRLFNTATYYAPDVFLDYALVFLIPVGVGGNLAGRAGDEQATDEIWTMIASSTMPTAQ